MVAYFIASDEHMMIAWVHKFHCKIVFQFDFHTGGPYLIFLGTESAIFQEYSWILLICSIFMRQSKFAGCFLSMICPSIHILSYYKSKCRESK